MRDWKMWEKLCAAASLLAVTFCLIAGLEARANNENSRISGIRTIAELEQADIRLEAALGYMEYAAAAAEEEKVYERFTAMQEEWVKETENAPVILRVKPTERIEISGESLKQYFIVAEVIRGGEDIAAGQEASVCSPRIWQPQDGWAGFVSHTNLMYDDWEYLLFLEASPLNAYQEETEFFWSEGNSLFSCIRLGEEETETLPNLGGPLEKYRSYAFFAVSARLVQLTENIHARLIGYTVRLSKGAEEVREQQAIRSCRK